MFNVWDTMVRHTNDIQSLFAAGQQNEVHGSSFSVNFKNHPNGPLDPAIYDVLYTGVGTSLVSVQNGVAGWMNPVNDAHKTAKIRYKGGRSQTDYQLIQGSLASTPQVGNGGSGNPKIWAAGRLSADWQNFVFARAYAVDTLAFRADLGCYVNGVETIFRSNIGLTWNTNISVRLGVSGNPRRYQVFSGNTLVDDYTESGAVSRLPSLQGVPADYLWVGLITEMRKGDSARLPGSLAGFSLSDSTTPLVAGTGAQMVRLNTAVEDIDSGSNLFGGDFFDNIEYQSTDITPRLDLPGFVAQKAGLYRLGVRIRHTTTDAQTFTYFTQINNVLDQWGTGNNMDRTISSHAEFLVKLSVGTPCGWATTGPAVVSTGSSARWTAASRG